MSSEQRFQGGVKRWHWKGGDKGHGSMHHRAPGSIGASSDPSRVYKGQHLPGRMGGIKTTVQNLKVLKVDLENNLLIIKGAVPGANNSRLIINRSKKKKAAAILAVSDNIITGQLGFTDFRYFNAEMRMTDLAFGVVESL